MTGIFWGLPPFDYKVYHADEPKIILGAYHFPEEVATRTDLRYPTAYHYTLGLLVWPLKKALEAKGYQPYFVIYLLGRLLTVFLGTLTILFTYWLACKVFDARHGMCASFILTFSMLHVTNSAWATTDVASAFFLTAFYLFLIKTLQQASLWHALLAGVMLGMLIGTKYTGAIAIVPCLLLFMHHHQSKHPASFSDALFALCRNPSLGTIGGTALLVFGLSTPGILFHPGEFLASLQSEQARLVQLQRPCWDIMIWKTQFSALIQALGFPLACVACIGTAASFIRRPAIEASLGALVCAFCLLFRNALLPRYIILIMPVLAVLASRILLVNISFPKPLSRMLSYGGILLVLGHAVLYSTFAIAERYPDTRTQATDFIFDHLPRGASIGIAYTSRQYPHQYHGWRYPLIDFNQYPYRDFLEFPDYVIVSSYDSDPILKTLRNGSLSAAYEIPETLQKEWYRSAPPEPEIFEFFDKLYFQAQLPYQRIAEFRPQTHRTSIEFPAPVIEVFMLRASHP